MTPNIRRGSTHKYDHFLTFKNKPFLAKNKFANFTIFHFHQRFQDKISTNSKGDKSDFHQRDDTIRISVWAQTIDLHLDRQCGRCTGVDPPNSTFVNLNINSWKDWIMKLPVLWFFSRWSGWKRYAIVVGTMIEVRWVINTIYTPDNSIQFL